MERQASLLRLPGGSGAAIAINNSGAVVGKTGGGATLWEDGAMIDLTSMLDLTGSGWILFIASDINNRGQITGIGSNTSGQTRGFLLTPNPVPIPGALPLLLSALGFLGFFGWRRKRLAAA